MTSVGVKRDSYANSPAETANGLYKTELIYRLALEDVRTGRARNRRVVSWWNEQRLHEACGYVPPAGFEESYFRRLAQASSVA